MSFKCPSCGRFTKHDKPSCSELACTYHCRKCNLIHPVIQSLKVIH